VAALAITTAVLLVAVVALIWYAVEVAGQDGGDVTAPEEGDDDGVGLGDLATARWSLPRPRMQAPHTPTIGRSPILPETEAARLSTIAALGL
jgi:hypothetical protein